MKPFFYLLRPQQWLKNLFVLAGVIFAHAWQDVVLVQQALITMFAFCLLSSAVYVFNDIVDRAADRAHPIKQYRPIAAGVISIKHAFIYAAVLGIVSLLISLSVNKLVLAILLAYLALNIAYSLFFKQQVILDVFVIAVGFLLRILAGTVGIDIMASGWLLFCSFGLTLFLGFCKRHAEIQFHSSHYSENLLNKFIIITATSSIMGYALYTLQQDELLFAGTHYFIYTIPFVVFGIFRYLYLLENQKNSGVDVARDLMRDKPLLITIMVWLLIIVVLGLK
jgi:4-hydroxybenzoate polyprenyltransferase